MRQISIDFASKRLSLEGILTTPGGMVRRPGVTIPKGILPLRRHRSKPQDQSMPPPTLLVCHPHPTLGGNMQDPVVVAICDAADRFGIVTLRFNFRGVGGSEGEFSNGRREREDVTAALDVLKQWPGLGGEIVAIVGYSFGASMVLSGLGRYKFVRSLVLIAPPISAVRQSRIRRDKRPKLFVVGDRDRVAPSVELQRELDQMRPPVQFAEIEGADHTLQNHEEEVADRVAAFVAETLTE